MLPQGRSLRLVRGGRRLATLASRAASSSTPGDGSCTWRATHVKTVASSCLFDARRGFVDECKKQDRAPYTQPKKILQAAFDDLKAGGCPAIPGPPGSARAA